MNALNLLPTVVPVRVRRRFVLAKRQLYSLRLSMLSSRPISVHRDYYDVPDFTSKTPGRALKGRAGLQENALHHGSLTANPKEKRAILQTPLKKDASSMFFVCTKYCKVI